MHEPVENTTFLLQMVIHSTPFVVYNSGLEGTRLSLSQCTDPQRLQGTGRTRLPCPGFILLIFQPPPKGSLAFAGVAQHWRKQNTRMWGGLLDNGAELTLLSGNPVSLGFTSQSRAHSGPPQVRVLDWAHRVSKPTLWLSPQFQNTPSEWTHSTTSRKNCIHMDYIHKYNYRSILCI